jgi:hypothetical protein
MTPSLDGRWITVAALLLVIIGAGTLIITNIDGGADTQEGSTVTDLLDKAKERTGEVRQMQVAANRVFVQWISGVGIGLGLGLIVGGYGTYLFQKKRLEEEFS